MRLGFSSDWLQSLKQYLNPAYHVRKLRQDLGALWHSVRSHGEFARGNLDAEAMAQAFRGKLLASYLLSGPFSAFAHVGAYALQRHFNNPYVGQYSQPMLSMVITTLAFQIIWLLGTFHVYRQEKSNLGGRFLALERDLLPVHWAGIRIGMTFNLITWPLSSLIIFLIELANRQAAVAIPASLVMMVIDYAIVNTSLMRMMGDFFERWSLVLAERHTAKHPPAAS